MIHYYGLEKNLFINAAKIIPVDSNYFEFPAKRPIFSLLNSQKTYKITNYTPPHWSKSIEILINSLDYNFIEKRKGEWK